MRAVLQRPQLVGVQRRPCRAVDARRERVRVVGRQAGERQHLAVARIENDRRAVEARAALKPPRPPAAGRSRSSAAAACPRPALLARRSPISRPTLLTTTRLRRRRPSGAGCRSSRRPAARRSRRSGRRTRPCQLRVADLADVAEQVRGQRLGGYCRVGTSSTMTSGSSKSTSRRDRRDLRQRRVLDDDDRPVARLASMAIDDVAAPASGRAPATRARSLAVRSRSLVCSRTMEMVKEWRFSTSTLPLRSNRMPRGARRASVR